MVLETLVKKRPQLVHPPFGLGEHQKSKVTSNLETMMHDALEPPLFVGWVGSCRE